MLKRANFWSDKKIVITGGNGFLGTRLIAKLKTLNPKNLISADLPRYDLRRYDDCIKAFKGSDIVIHLAANVGGIGYNQKFPATLFEDNLLLGINTLKAAKDLSLYKYVGIGTICSYPKDTPTPFKENYLWNGYPEGTNAPYGLAKKMLIVQSEAYKKQYGFNSINLLPVNMYGPGDNFNPKSSHVIPSLIKKFVDAKNQNKKTVIIWGSGNPTREFLYVEDAAKAIVLATSKYNKTGPVNLGSGKEISIKNLALLISKIVGYSGKMKFDKSKPDGQPRRKLDTTLAEREFGFCATTNFETGLTKTIRWYLSNY